MNLIETLNKKLLEERKNHVGSGKIKPSMLGCCFQRAIWDRQGVEPSDPPDARSLRIFAVGKLFHDFIQGMLPEHECEVLVETPDIKGYADIVTDKEVIDVKSCHSGMFTYLSKPNYDINKEKRSNILQCACYAWLLDKPVFKLVFISRDDLRISEYAFYTDKWKREVEKELDLLRKYWFVGEAPSEPRAYKSACRYCNFQKLCKEKKEGDLLDKPE